MKTNRQGRAATRSQESGEQSVALLSLGRNSSADAGNRQTKAPTVQELLAQAVKRDVAVSDIDLEDGTFDFRLEPSEEIDPEAIASDDGVFDGTVEPDPIVLFETSTRKLVIVAGRRRLSGLAANPAIKFVRCFVLSGSADFGAVVIAARANLLHGAKLTQAERLACFKRDWAEHTRAGIELPKTAWATIYQVSRQTVHNWGNALRAPHPTPPLEPTQSRSVQSLHIAPEAAPFAADVDAGLLSPDVKCPAPIQPALQVANAASTTVRTRDKYGAREAACALKVALAMVMNADATELQPFVAELQADLGKLAAFLNGIAEEVVA